MTGDRMQELDVKNGLPRIFDLVLAGLGLAVLMPLLLVLGVVVRLSSSGPILFKQPRVGRGGKPFVLYKLRTMISSSTGPQVTSGNDSRITAAGKFLRRTKLDELPTLWNVVRGDMALVGPRPEVSRYVDIQDPNWQVVLKAKPGITDPVTLKLRNEEKLLAAIGGDTEKYYIAELQPLKLKGYVAYLRQRTWRSDLSVLGRTMMAVIISPNSGEPSSELVSGQVVRSSHPKH